MTPLRAVARPAPLPALALLLVALALVPGVAFGQPACPEWLWTPLDQTGLQGANATVYASTMWDPDGGGPQPERLVLGGAFDQIQVYITGPVAQHDPVTGAWGGFNTTNIGPVKALGSFNNQLIVGGPNIRRWNGSVFEVMGAGIASGEVRAIAVHDGQLYIGGSFTLVGGGSYFARWNGSGWETVTFGGPNDAVDAMVSWGGSLILGGAFTQVGSPPFSVGHVARFDGTWNAMGSAMDNVVLALQPYGGFLYAGGSFHTANGAQSGGLSRWNGSAWSPVGGFFDGIVYSLGFHAGQLVIGGDFPGINLSPNLARYDGVSYSTYGAGGANGFVRTIMSAEGQLYLGGQFNLVAGVPAKSVARWNGSAWAALGGGTAAQVRAIAPFSGGLVVAGDFATAVDPNPTAFRIATWNGQKLTNFGNGMNGLVLSLESFRNSGLFSNLELIAGGYFTQAGTVAANRIARWNYDPLTPIPPPAWQAMGVGFNDAVYAIKRFNNVTYAAGTFTASGGTPVSRIAKWNETTDVWEPVGTGMNGTVYALEVYNGALYAGGSFTTAGGVSSGGFARWNGSSWSNIGGFFLGTVYALEVHDGRLVMAGQFAGFGGSPNLSSTNGSSYQNYGVGGADGPIYALQSHDSKLFIGGDFAFAGNLPARRLASWDGTSWSEVYGGTDDAIYALGSYQGELQVGGWFTTAGTEYTTYSARWVRYSSTGLPPFTRQPTSTTVSPGATASFTAEFASNYPISDWHWYRGNDALSDGPTGTGSSISGATQSTLTITNVSLADAGIYLRRIVSSCGVTTSNQASLSLNVVGVGDESPTLRTALELVAPNPARGQTAFTYTLARPARVSLGVYDVSGRLGKRIERGVELAGRHACTWDARTDDGVLARPGLYFVRLEVDGRAVGTRKLVVGD